MNRIFRRKGQVITGDFIVSIAIFLMIVSIIIPSFMYVSDQVRSGNQRQDVDIRSIFMSDTLVKTAGYPDPWNSSSVQAIGLSGSGGLSLFKIRNFIYMDYDASKALLGIPDLEYNVTFIDLRGYKALTGVATSPAAYFYVQNNSMEDMINNTGLVWDLYYGGTGVPDTRDASNVYSGQKIDVFNSLLSNRSAYRTIMVEDPQLLQSDVNISDLKDFTKKGGIIILTGGADIISSGFSMHSGQTSLADGIVLQQGDFLDAGINSSVIFLESGWYFYSAPGDSPIENLIADASDNSIAYVARWPDGFGNIYYARSLDAPVEGKTLRSFIYPVGKSAEKGPQPAAASTISIVRRVSFITGLNKPVKITMLVWK